MSESKNKRGPYAKTAERRLLIAQAAWDLVADRGHPAVSAADVAERAGVTEATVLYHFPTRDELFVAALALGEILDDRRMEESRLTEPEDLLRLLTEGGESFLNTRRLFAVEMAASLDPGHPAHDYAAQHQRATAKRFCDFLRVRQEEGVAHPDIDPERFGRQMVAIWDGLQSQWLVDQSIDLTGEVAAAFRALTRQDIMWAKRAIEAVTAEM